MCVTISRHFGTDRSSMSALAILASTEELKRSGPRAIQNLAAIKPAHFFFL